MATPKGDGHLFDEERDGARDSEPVKNPLAIAMQKAAAPSPMVEVEMQRAIAQVQAAYMMAKANPRDEVRAMELILRDCTRPTLAAKSLYEYSRGGSEIQGPSIRLAEAIAQRWGHLECGVMELTRMAPAAPGEAGYSLCMAYAVDLQTGFRDSKTFQVKHWRDTKKGGYPVTDERDIYEVVANNGARRKRACILTIIPGDVVEAAVEQCDRTMKLDIELNEAAFVNMLEAFAKYEVTREMLEKRVQRRFESMTPGMFLQLKRVYTSLKDEMSVVSDWFDVPEAKKEDAPAAGGRKAPKRKAKVEKPAEPGKTADADKQPAPPPQDMSLPIGPAEVRFVRNKLEGAALGEDWLCKALGIVKLEDMRFAVLQGALKMISDPMSVKTGD